jgi:hypothetical protein
VSEQMDYLTRKNLRASLRMLYLTTNSLMKRFEKIIIGLIIGSTFPLLLGLLSVVIWFYLDRSEDRAVLYLII